MIAAEAEILGAIGSIKSDKRCVNAVKLAARNAVIADQLLRPQEEIVLARIARALGLDPDDF